MAFPSSVRRDIPFPRLTHDHRRSHFGPGLSVSPLRSPGCTGREKELPVLFTTPHSFFFEFEKRHFNSSRVPLRFGKGSFPCLSPGLICSSFVPQEQISSPQGDIVLAQYPQGEGYIILLQHPFHLLAPAKVAGEYKSPGSTLKGAVLSRRL